MGGSLNGAHSDICSPGDQPGDGTVIGVLAAALGASSGSRRKEIIDMRKLDRTRPFGTMKGQPYQPEGCDRIVAYEQDGHLFDAQDRQVVPGLSLQAARAQRRQADQHRDEAAAELVAHADKVAPTLLKSMAKLILGAKKCPSKKADIISALQALLADGKAAAAAMGDDEDAKPVRADRTVPAVGKAAEVNGHRSRSFQSMTGAKSAATTPAAKPQPAKPSPPPSPQRKNGVNVDLAAWGSGQKQYPFHGIRRAIEELLGVAVTDATAALEALIDKGVVAFKDARKDLLPPAAAIEVEDQVDS